MGWDHALDGGKIVCCGSQARMVVLERIGLVIDLIYILVSTHITLGSVVVVST